MKMNETESLEDLTSAKVKDCTYIDYNISVSALITAEYVYSLIKVNKQRNNGKVEIKNSS